ncbi:sodium- and chloride-dependent glycine transporter 2 isoform X2 [Cryptotermes secundus]|uniref:sodium- and chloride-dependent glycine transporter 2 isoform X2 n=1 Tax=Cryptotermes secundus TaxID=105785 RepID=UPI001454D375|nr:sodium- and chloride-dependent glycine transporter 2 isoform X2 [Cryptotermes secundus]
MVDQHTELSITSAVSSLTNNTEVSNTNKDVDSKFDCEYEENCNRYPATTDTQQKMHKGRYRSTWNERGVFFLTSLGFTTGLGFSMCWSSIVFSISEACLLSWSVLYIYNSGDCDLPWAHYHNYTGMTSSAKYFTGEILGVSSGLEIFGSIQGSLVIGLAITWGAVAACLAAGIRHTGKLCYVATPITFLVAGILLVRGLLLWSRNVSQAVSPDWSSLTDLTVWMAAGCYVFHSLNLGLGGLTAISSHNKQNTNLLRDAVLICLFHFVWGVMMWLVYVCLMADYRASNQFPKNITGGPWIVFVVFARGLAALPHGIVFSLAMYIMVFFVGIGTLLGTILVIVSTFLDFFPALHGRRGPVTISVCIVLFLVGLPLTSQAGFHIQLLLSYYSVNWPLILYSLCMTLAISYSYGQKRYISELCCISNIKLQETTMTHLIVLFTTGVPVLLMVLLFCSFYHTSSPPDGQTPYPSWAKAVGWLLSTSPAVFLLAGAVLRFLQFCQKQSLIQSFKLLLKPDEIFAETLSSSHHSSSCEKTTMTTPIIAVESKDFFFVPSINTSDGNNNLSLYNNRSHKADPEHSSF